MGARADRLLRNACDWRLGAGVARRRPASDAARAILHIDRDCKDEYGRNLCEARLRDFIVRSFKLEPAESLPPTRAPQLRVFMIDGYSQDLPALVFTGLDGDDARLDVYSQMAAPSRDGPNFSFQLNAEDARAARALADGVRRSAEKVAPPLQPAARPRGAGRCRLRRPRRPACTAGRLSWK